MNRYKVPEDARWCPINPACPRWTGAKCGCPLVALVEKTLPNATKSLKKQIFMGSAREKE